MEHRAKVAELRKPQHLAVQPPDLGVRLSEPEKTTPLALPARLPSDTLKAALPGLVELDQQLRAHVAWDVCQPRQFSPQRCQLADLVERCVVAALVTWATKAQAPLLVGKVPQEAQRRLPPEQTRLLLSCRVHTKAECFANEHCVFDGLANLQVKSLSGVSERHLISKADRGQREGLRRSLVVAKLLRTTVRRAPARDRQALRRTTTWRGFLPALKDGVCAPKTR
ncbi:MAG: hypothetical protein RLZZ450_4634 [Pseudomonadota bacterium]|jgi:hypothetical protein